MNVLLKTKTRRIAFVLLLSLVFVSATTLGSVWHHHSSPAAESSCPICHMSHQTAQQQTAVSTLPSVSATFAQPVFVEILFPDVSVSSHLTTRAPPSL